MSIGGTLARARLDAGLTITEVSERTCIRETIIRGIEQDDYSACGGDFYARGHLRSIARVVGADPVALVGEYDATIRAPEEITAAEALQPMLPIGSRGGRRADEHGGWRGPDAPRRQRRVNLTAILGLALLAVVAFIGYRLATGGSGHAPAAARGHSRQSAARARPTVTRSATSPATPSAATLTPVSAAAFGPGGTAQGDNPQNAQLALAGNPATPWHTSWYATANFGNLRSGTGLLLDLGRPVTVTSARITLGSIPGADIELRAGNVPTLAGLQTVATATNAGSVLQLQPAGPVRGRYLLIWFTLLPPDGSGTYQADISAVSLQGEA